MPCHDLHQQLAEAYIAQQIQTDRIRRHRMPRTHGSTAPDGVAKRVILEALPPLKRGGCIHRSTLRATVALIRSGWTNRRGQQLRQDLDSGVHRVARIVRRPEGTLSHLAMAGKMRLRE